MVGSFRKKPIVITAVRLPFTVEDAGGWADVVGFLHGFANWKGGNLEGCIRIETLEGEMRADMGDWIIKGVKGEFYPCKPDVFSATYECVEG